MSFGSVIRDPGSGINLFRIPGSKRHRIPDPEHCLLTEVSTFRRGFDSKSSIMLELGTFRPSQIQFSNFWQGRIRIQCCGSDIFIPDPDFYPSRIRTPDVEEKKLVVLFDTSLTRNLQIC